MSCYSDQQALPSSTNLQYLSQNMFFLFQFNFVGKLLGPKGNSMKRLQEETMTKMAVLGKGSMRDKQKVRQILILSFFLLIRGRP